MKAFNRSFYGNDKLFAHLLRKLCRESGIIKYRNVVKRSIHFTFYFIFQVTALGEYHD